MKKYFAIFAAVAILGMLAIYFVPEKTITKATSMSVAASSAPAATTTTTASTPVTTSVATTTTTATAPTSTTTTTSGAYKDGSYNGSTSSTPYGDVQVAITVSGGKISNVTFLSLPNSDNHSARISSQASPMLKSQTLSAQSAGIDGVSGATYTSEGYVQSLQSAIDSAKV
jgi:uncharacterized protein with FMN-binding domain